MRDMTCKKKVTMTVSETVSLRREAEKRTCRGRPAGRPRIVGNEAETLLGGEPGPDYATTAVALLMPGPALPLAVLFAACVRL
jgi:hypothetical protein